MISYSILDLIDWNSCTESTVQVEGWKGPLTIQYMLVEPRMFIWRIKGTEKVFRINFDYVEKNHSKVEQHFEKVLSEFRNDYIEWVNENISYDWFYKYKSQYESLIIL